VGSLGQLRHVVASAEGNRNSALSENNARYGLAQLLRGSDGSAKILGQLPCPVKALFMVGDRQPRLIVNPSGALQFQPIATSTATAAADATASAHMLSK
jgi:hypothetical protein